MTLTEGNKRAIRRLMTTLNWALYLLVIGVVLGGIYYFITTKENLPKEVIEQMVMLMFLVAVPKVLLDIFFGPSVNLTK